MDGITILYSETLPTMWAIWLGLMVIVAVTCAIIAFAEDMPGLTIPTALLVAVAIAIGVLLPLTYTRLECVADSSVRHAEVVEHYDIIERHGDIWVLREKTQEGDCE